MVIALLVLGSVYWLVHRRLPLSRSNWRIYVAATLGIFPNMLFVYHAAQYIPSGLVSVLFGMSPFFIGALSALWLHDHVFNAKRIVATLIALGGLAIIFADQIQLDQNSWRGIALMVASNLCFAASSVLIKRENRNIDAWEQTLGSLMLAVPCLLICWIMFDHHLPQDTTLRSNLAIAYLAVIGSLAGMWCFFYALNSLPVDRVALIPLLTPVLALTLGHVLAHEPLRLSLLIGSGTILLGLALYDPVLLSRWTRRFFGS